jgi:hypothetical protein
MVFFESSHLWENQFTPGSNKAPGDEKKAMIHWTKFQWF